MIFALLVLSTAIAAQVVPDEPNHQVGAVTIHPVYHGSLYFEWDDKIIWIDPSTKADLTGLPKADLLLLSHAHRDHMDLRAIQQIRRKGSPVVAPRAVANELAAHGIAVDYVLRAGDSMTVGDLGAQITGVPMYNDNRGGGKGPTFHAKGWGVGYIVELGGTRIFVGADTECTPEVRALTGLDAALLPMNLPYTMSVEEATQCYLDMAPGVAVPYHFRTSDLTPLMDTLAGHPDIEVRLWDWYQGRDPGVGEADDD